ncbi:hypothetical protein Vi05172_g6964 [Venturia inaequalis]|nr:hypothetical protein Vi05172_g6964 [Venturia inaequalis]
MECVTVSNADATFSNATADTSRTGYMRIPDGPGNVIAKNSYKGYLFEVYVEEASRRVCTFTR